MKRTLVLDVVGLTPALIGEHTPHLKKLAERGRALPLKTITPAVTCSVQSTFLTGKLPREHGAVANGWYFRELAQVWLWRQNNALVEGEKLWHAARRRDPRFTCAKLFWWFNMYADVDWAVTPRPIYRADGRKLPDIHTHPSELRDTLNAALGTFPLFNFWGPRADIVSSEWIANCAREIEERYRPTLNLVYLPHLDYELQRSGPRGAKVPEELRRIDAVCGRLIDDAQANGRRVVVLSEYGITEVRAPVHINRALRERGWLKYRIEEGEEHFDAGVIFTVFSQSPLPAALLLQLSGIGLRLAWGREKPYQLLTDWLPEDEPESGIRHEVSRQLDLVAAIGARTAHHSMSLRTTDAARQKVDSLLCAHGLGSARWLVLHPGASAASRRYPAFAEVARMLMEDESMQIVLTGSEAELPLVESIRDAAPDAISLAGKLDLPELVALIDRAPVLITNNTGPAHIASALGTPVVDVYAGTNPQHTPWLTPNRVLSRDVPCAPCFRSICPEGHHACLASIEPREVVKAAKELLYAPLVERI